MPSELYPTPEINSITDLLGYANLYTGNSFILLTIIAIWYIAFAWFKRYETKTAIAGATTLTFLISIPLSFIKFKGYPLLAPEITVILLVLTGICGVWLWKSEE